MTTFGTRFIVAAGVASLAVAATLDDAAAQRGRNRGGAASSLPQVACAAGAPEATPFAIAAQDALNRIIITRENARAPLYTQAADQARQGIAANEENPYHHFLLGRALIGLADYQNADASLRRALELCPEFAGEVRDARREAYQTLFTAGMTAFERNDTTTALDRWMAAGAIYNELPDPFFNAGALAASRGDEQRAQEAYREAVAAADRAANTFTDQPEILAEVVETRARALAGLTNMGVRAFQADNFARAHEVLSEVVRANPNDRLAVYVQALSLYKMDRWNDLVPVATRVLELEPLNYNAYLLLFNAQKGIAEAAAAQNNTAAERAQRDQMVRTLARADSIPINVESVHEVEGGKLVGEAAHGAAAAGTPVALEFTLHGVNGVLATERVTVQAPAEGAKVRFEVPIPSQDGETALVTGYSYRVVQ